MDTSGWTLGKVLSLIILVLNFVILMYLLFVTGRPHLNLNKKKYNGSHPLKRKFSERYYFFSCLVIGLLRTPIMGYRWIPVSISIRRHPYTNAAYKFLSILIYLGLLALYIYLVTIYRPIVIMATIVAFALIPYITTTVLSIILPKETASLYKFLDWSVRENSKLVSKSHK